LILSALGSVDDRDKGLRAGGDDYLVKPFAFSELLARIEALLRRGQAAPATTSLRVADLELDLLTRSVKRGGKPIELLPREFSLLEYLMRNSGQVVTRTMLLEHVWDYHFDPQTNVIDVHVSRLRQKIDKNFDRPLLHTVRGAGYCLRAPGAVVAVAASFYPAAATIAAHPCVSARRPLFSCLCLVNARGAAVCLLEQRRFCRAPDRGHA
jgi:two-component system OmpR family response regulator